MTSVKAVITTLDNLLLLKEQIPILESDPLVNEIVIVCNGSKDGTAQWLGQQSGLTTVIRDNMGAGPGRNSGLDAAGECDYLLMLDGGIRPLRDGTRRMLDYLDAHVDVDVLGVEIADFETDYDKAWRRWPQPIPEAHVYKNTMLTHTAYCLARYKAFDGWRFSEEGPFGQPGWGADDNELAFRWTDGGIEVRVIACGCSQGVPCNGAHPYRRGSGSFQRLFQDTGIWPNQFGSVYEQRVVYLQQNWPQYWIGCARGYPWLTVVINVEDLDSTIRLIKRTHDLLRLRRFDKPHENSWNPYSIVAWMPKYIPEFAVWAEHTRLCQHHGNVIIVNGSIVRRKVGNEDTWTGDFRLWTESAWQCSLREPVYYYALVRTVADLNDVLSKYTDVCPVRDDFVVSDHRPTDLSCDVAH